MSQTATSRRPSRPSTAALALTGGRVLPEFRDAVFNAAGRAGVTVNEFVLRAVGAELARHGEDFPGVFRPGDVTGDREAA